MKSYRAVISDNSFMLPLDLPATTLHTLPMPLGQTTLGEIEAQINSCLSRRFMLKLSSAQNVGLILALSLALQACGGSFAGQLRVILAASGPLIQSLPLPDALKNGLIVDFTDLATGAATLKESLDGCADKPCKLAAVERYESLFEQVEARGHFGSHARLQQIEGILRGIIASAKIYYGGSSPSIGVRSNGKPKSLDAQIEDLKRAMQP